MFGDKSFGKTEQVEQNQGDQECSGVGSVGCSFTRVFRVSFLERETVEQRLEGQRFEVTKITSNSAPALYQL